MTNFKKDIKGHTNRLNESIRRVAETTQNAGRKGDAGSCVDYFKCTEGYWKEGCVTLYMTPEDRTMTAI